MFLLYLIFQFLSWALASWISCNFNQDILNFKLNRSSFTSQSTFHFWLCIIIIVLINISFDAPGTVDNHVYILPLVLCSFLPILSCNSNITWDSTCYHYLHGFVLVFFFFKFRVLYIHNFFIFSSNSGSCGTSEFKCFTDEFQPKERKLIIRKFIQQE